MKKITTLTVFILLLLLSSRSVMAFDLIDFIAQSNFPEHELITDETVEHVRYTSEGGSGPGSPARQYKNSLYEQFFVSNSGIFRREDSSWENRFCANNNPAAYTLDGGACTTYSDGQEVPQDSGALWAPATGSNNGDTITQGAHQIVAIDSTQLPSLKYCALKDTGGEYDSPNTCGTRPSMQVTYLEAGQHTFCTGITNAQPVVKLTRGTEEIVYMQGCGLVGFKSDFMWSGLGSSDGSCKMDSGAVEQLRNSPGFQCFRNISGGGSQLDCKPLSEYGGGGGGTGGGFINTIIGALGRLASLFSAAPPPVSTTDAECGLASNLVADSLDRPQGKPICPDGWQDSNNLETVYGNAPITVTGLGASSQITLPIFSIFTDEFDKPQHTAGDAIPDYGVSEQTADPVTLKTANGYLNNNFDKVEIEKRINFANDTNPDKSAREFMKDIGAVQKLSPLKCFSKITNSWELCTNVWREEVLKLIMRNYSCELLSGKHCDKPRAMDVIAGYLHTVDGSDSPGAATWVSAKCPTEICRPQWASEFVCMNSNWSVPGELSRDEIAYMCNIIMGPLHHQGLLTGDGVIGSQSAYDLRSCAEDCKYGPGRAWWYIPTTATHEISAHVLETTNRGEDDPEQETKRAKPIGIPGVVQSLTGTERLSNMINPKAVQDSRVAFEAPTEVCVAAEVEGDQYDYLSRARIEKQPNGFLARWLGSGQAQGASTGEVLQAADPPPSPLGSPVPSPEMDTHGFNRNGDVKIFMGKEFELLVTQTEEINDAINPKAVGDTFEVPVGGVPLKALGTGLQYTCTDGEFSCESKDVGIPAAGGPLNMALRPGNSVLSEAILPYNPNKATSMSRFMKQLADEGRKSQPLAKSPWQRLASLFVPDRKDVAVK